MSTKRTRKPIAPLQRSFRGIDLDRYISSLIAEEYLGWSSSSNRPNLPTQPPPPTPPPRKELH